MKDDSRSVKPLRKYLKFGQKLSITQNPLKEKKSLKLLFKNLYLIIILNNVDTAYIYIVKSLCFSADIVNVCVFKQHRFSILQLCRLKVPHGTHWSKSRCWPGFFLLWRETTGKLTSFPFPMYRGYLLSLGGPFATSRTQHLSDPLPSLHLFLKLSSSTSFFHFQDPNLVIILGLFR